MAAIVGHCQYSPRYKSSLGAHNLVGIHQMTAHLLFVLKCNIISGVVVFI